jgi:leucyl-tRNA synthetase
MFCVLSVLSVEFLICDKMDYNFNEIEKKWQKYWSDHKTFKAENHSDKPKYYVLDMFPYPSGSGLHVGHPLGYIASDIYSRYKRLKGFNVLHPMGYDAYGLPAEQYAIQTGQHPSITTEKNIARYREQLDKIGFSFDWEREVRTSDPFYYKWTQWTFLKLFNSWYNKNTDKAEPIEKLITVFEKNGNTGTYAAATEISIFSAEEWKTKSEKEQQETLMHYRLAYLADTMVNWCPALGTVLANDEVSEGFSVRGGHPVTRKTMKQWSLRITAYADRLLKGLDEIDWSDSIKEIQRNWIGKSVGAMIKFPVKGHDGLFMEIFTTRPDTIFGVTYMTFAPEHESVRKITTIDRRESVEKYVNETQNRSERERIADVKRISGEFTGAYAINPFTNEEIQIWVGDYVLAGYGTGAVMAVPGHDSRDWAFANHFKLPIKEVIKGGDISIEAYEPKEGVCVNSGFINGLSPLDASKVVIAKAVEMGVGYGKVNYRLRDAIFSRQRYWGEPFPIYYKEGVPYAMEESGLPLELPEVDAFLPTETGEPPLARAKNWKTKEGYPIETNTMPGFAGSSAYYYRYMDAANPNELASKEANTYWENVDLYIGGAEHATGHLLYARFWNKFLFDLGIVCKEEPFKKLINQGMIQGVSQKIYREGGGSSDDTLSNSVRLFDIEKGLVGSVSLPKETMIFYSADIFEKYLKNSESFAIGWAQIRVPIDLVKDGFLNIEKYIESFTENKNAVFVTNDGGFWIEGKYYIYKLDDDGIRRNYQVLDVTDNFKSKSEVEKMSKGYFNVITPDILVEDYGADTLRLYEMFLGPLEQHKPWDTKGIEGVFRFIRKLWKLYHDFDNKLCISDEPPTKNELKVLHKTIKKVQEDIERFSFNTAVSTFMICVNELTELKCNKRAVLKELPIILSPYAPHIAEELWSLLGNEGSITHVNFPAYNEEYLSEDNCTYAVSFNGKMRFTMDLPVDLPAAEVEKQVLANEVAQKWLEGKAPKKVIVVPRKIVNVVI